VRIRKRSKKRQLDTGQGIEKKSQNKCPVYKERKRRAVKPLWGKHSLLTQKTWGDATERRALILPAAE